MQIPIIQSSLIAIVIGVVLLGIGIWARQQERPYAQYVLNVGGILMLLGVLGLVAFMVGWELAHS